MLDQNYNISDVQNIGNSMASKYIYLMLDQNYIISDVQNIRYSMASKHISNA